MLFSTWPLSNKNRNTRCELDFNKIRQSNMPDSPWLSRSTKVKKNIDFSDAKSSAVTNEPGFSMHYKERTAMQDWHHKTPTPHSQCDYSSSGPRMQQEIKPLEIPSQRSEVQKTLTQIKKLKKSGLLYHKGQFGRTVTIFKYEKVKWRRYWTAFLV